MRHVPRILSIWVVLGLLGLTAPEASAQQADSLQRARSLYQTAKTAYEEKQYEASINTLEQIEELLANRRGPSVDTLRALRLALLSKAQYHVGELGGAQRAHIKMTKIGAVPPILTTDEMADHRQQVEATLMKELPQAVQESIRTAATMDKLNLSDRDLVGLPDSIGQLTDLRRLSLRRNDLSALPETIGQLSHLEELDLRGNQLTTLPESIGQLSDLEVLELGENKLIELPNSIGQLENLRRLGLRNNDLSIVPESVGQLPLLNGPDGLDISGNSASLNRQPLMLRDSTEVDGSWVRQTAQVLVPIEDRSVRIFVDELTRGLSRRDSLQDSLTVRRGPAQPKQPLSELRTELINEEGIVLSAASHVRIDYEFRKTERGFEEKIQAIHFFYRLESENKEDIPLLYVDGQKPWVQDLFIDVTGHYHPHHPRRKVRRAEMAFARVVEGKNTILLQIGGREVREGFEWKKQKFIQKIKRLTYER